MASVFDIALAGKDEPGTWMTAAALSAKGLKVALLLDQAPDPEIDEFPWMPLPLSLRAERGEVKLVLRRTADIPFEPLFQAIVQARPVDFGIEEPFLHHALARDLGHSLKDFLALASECSRQAAAFGDSFGKDSSALGRLVLGSSGLLDKIRRRKPPPSGASVAERLCRESPFPASLVKALAVAGRGVPLREEEPFIQAALAFDFAWRKTRAMESIPLRDKAAELIASTGAVFGQGVSALVPEGKRIKAARLADGERIEARLFLASLAVLKKARNSAKTNITPKPERQRLRRKTLFFTVERETIPESLAPRAIVIVNPEKPLIGLNLFVLCLSPRVPKRKTLAVTLWEERDAFAPDQVIAALCFSLPWLDQSRIAEDDTRETLTEELPISRYRLFPPPLIFPETRNLFPLPSETLPGWGLRGLELSLAALLPVWLKALKKIG